MKGKATKNGGNIDTNIKTAKKREKLKMKKVVRKGKRVNTNIVKKEEQRKDQYKVVQIMKKFRI